jgi:lipoprotein-anchoring transpeptidase ErfK/SrfK
MVFAGRGGFKLRYPGGGKHVEADLSRQVLALADGGKVVATYPTSSGAPVTPTILGHFRFYLKGPGTNAKGMYMSNFFIRGYAIHGYPSVPTYPASHGCLRVPNADAVSIYNWINLGDSIWVYR